ncbi:MAG: hypothetical protein HFE90_07560 [Firmicutes bacterium]|nr:hypothetical protein [Bacillota bacterium]
MNLHEKLVTCEKYIKENGYPDASIVRSNDGSEMIVFKIGNITAKYPNEKPNISVAFANGTMNNGEIDFDVMQVLCFVSSGIPSDRLMDIQKFCSDFNKAMQVGHFGVDFKHESVYFKCAQVVDKKAGVEYLLQIFDSVFTMIIFYFGYVYEILLELSYGIIGYGGTSHRLRERRRVMNEAMAELRGEDEAEEPSDPSERNQAIQELLATLKEENPIVLEEANINISSIRGKSERRMKKQVSAEETAAKIMDLATTLKEEKRIRKQKEAEEEQERIEIQARSTVSDSNADSLKNPMPSVSMFTERDRKKTTPLDMEGLQKALMKEHEERAKRKIENADRDNAQSDNSSEIRGNKKDVKIIKTDIYKNSNRNMLDESNDISDDKNQDSLIQRLRKWTQS